MVAMVPLGIGAVGAFGGSSSPTLSSTGKNNKGLIRKWDMRAAVIEGSSAACMQSRVKVHVNTCQGQHWEMFAAMR